MWSMWSIGAVRLRNLKSFVNVDSDVVNEFQDSRKSSAFALDIQALNRFSYGAAFNF